MSKVAIVTGASRGIGRAIAHRLAADGAAVVLCARDEVALRALAAEIAKAAVIPLDLRLPDSQAQLVAFTLAQFGRIDIVVNNAGATRRGGFLELTDDDWADGYALKLFGAVRLTREAWPHLKASAGSLVNIGGVGGRTPGAEFTIGGSVNAALLSFTKAMSDAGIRDGVQVNAVNPGLIRTARFDKRVAAMAREMQISIAQSEQQMIRDHNITRIGEPDDVANLVAFLCRPEGRLLQGALIDIDAGATKTI